MVNLRQVHPEIAAEFMKVFSSIALDQAHKQNNAAVKSDSGAVGLIQSSDALGK
jgi:hypothetical protein